MVRAELFIGPQSFTARGVTIEELMSGVLGAMEAARRAHGMSVGLMISVHRHRTEADAMAVLDQIMPWKDRIIGIGMGGAEVGNPPSKFARFFQAARARGFPNAASSRDRNKTRCTSSKVVSSASLNSIIPR